VGPAFTTRGSWGPVVAVAVHAGHELRPDVAARIALDDATRHREEDPHTDALTAVGDIGVVVHRSRFEVDLNRPRAAAVYRGPDDAWGLDVWKDDLPVEVVGSSRQIYDDFYARLARGLDDLVATRRRFVVLDIHSYNHRRRGPDAPPEPPADNPEVNVGTGGLDRDRWGGLVDRFVADLGRQQVLGHPLDVRENVRFRGGHLSRWVDDRYAGAGCALALEFKKTFMDEWTGAVDCGHLDALAAALRAVVPGLRAWLGQTA
jgi:N-formylglutamate amidohydrolase